MNRERLGQDWVVFGLALALSVMGLFFIFDAGYARSILADHGIVPREFRGQLVFLAFSLLVYFVCMRLSPLFWKCLSGKLFWFIVLMLVLVEIPGIGIEMNGARRWIGVGSFTVQPAEFMKVGVILYLAGFFVFRKSSPAPQRKIRNWGEWMDYVGVPWLRRSLPALWILLASYMIEREPDLGTAAVILAIAAVMLFLGGVSKRSLVVGVLIGALGVFFLVTLEPYRVERILHHSERWNVGMVDDLGYQTTQSETAMAGGGFWGVGIGSGRAKHMLPAATTDFILATIGEETGLLGALGVLAMLGVLAWRLMHLGMRLSDRFGQLVLFGTAAWLGVQSSVNVMMANGTLPAIGIPLPLISSGGSSLIAIWGCLGICQSLVRNQTKAQGRSV